MNIMLVSVTERIREIGLRKALGARPRLIRRQFLVEASVLGLAGGVLGVALGLVGAVALPLFSDSRVILSVPAGLGAIAMAIGIGVVFGVYPASRAGAARPHRRAQERVTMAIEAQSSPTPAPRRLAAPLRVRARPARRRCSRTRRRPRPRWWRGGAGVVVGVVVGRARRAACVLAAQAFGADRGRLPDRDRRHARRRRAPDRRRRRSSRSRRPRSRSRRAAPWPRWTSRSATR